MEEQDEMDYKKLYQKIQENKRTYLILSEMRVGFLRYNQR